MIQWAQLDLSIVRYAPWPSGTWSLRDKVTGDVLSLTGVTIEYGVKLYETTDTNLLLLTSAAGSGNRIIKDGDTFHPVVSQATLEGLPEGQPEDKPARFFHFVRVTHADGLAEVYARGHLTVYG